MEDIENRQDKRRGVVSLIIGILVFGSIWGFLEATLGGFLHLIIFPNKGAIMAGIGVPIVGGQVCTSQPKICLPCKNKKCFPKKEFNNIWIVTVGTNGKVSLQRSKYGD